MPGGDLPRVADVPEDLDEAHWIRICRVDEVPPGEIRGFAVPGHARPVLVANLGGRFVASASTCPHGRLSLLSGYLVGNRVVCPGHAYELDLDSGACREDHTLSLARYRLTVAGVHVFGARERVNAPGLLAM